MTPNCRFKRTAYGSRLSWRSASVVEKQDMAQITEDLARDALARCESGQHPPLTAWETQQLIYAWLERERMRRALHEIAEEWAGAECGEPVHAQEAYAIGLAKRMYALAVEGLTPNASLSGGRRPSD